MKLVVGATGSLGLEICRLLIADGKLVKAIVRDRSSPEVVDALWQLGVQVVHGDVRNPSSIEVALEGVSAVITTLSSMPFSYVPGENDLQTVDREGIVQLIDKATATGVHKFVYTSFSGQINLDFPLMHVKRWVEHHLQNSGMDYTILRPSYFMEAWLTTTTGFDATNGKVQVRGEGSKPVSYISSRDVARFAVDSLDNPAARNAILELGGPEAVSQLEAAAIFEEIGGKKIHLENIPESALQAKMDEATDPMQKSFAGLMLSLAQGDPIDMDEMLQNFPMQLTSVRDFAKDYPYSTSRRS